MRTPVSRVAAAAVFVLAVTGVALWLHGGGATYAFADFIAPILEAKSAKFKITTEIKGPPAATTTSEFMVLGATRSRQEMEMPDKSKGITIVDWGRGKSLTLDPARKKAMVVSLANLTKQQVSQQDPLAWFRSILLDARDKPDVKREPLGEKDIDGRRVVGFRVSSRGMVASLWGDPKTGVPVRAEATMAMFPNVKTTMSDFVFNVDMDESLFSTEPPAGYTVQNMKVDVSPAEEKDLTAAFREYSQLTGGAFPDSLDMATMMQTVGKMVGMKFGIQAVREKLASGKGKLNEEQMLHKFEVVMHKGMVWQIPGKEKPSEEELHKIEEQMRKSVDSEKLAPGKGKPDNEQMRKMTQAEMPKIMEASMKKVMEVQIPLQRGLLFALALPKDADAHYAGKGVSLGAADKPIFWYRPKDAKKYRVIYANLSVRGADAPPSVPNAQPVPDASNPKK
jgi:outer membrane lipoprotein-sorting protein